MNWKNTAIALAAFFLCLVFALDASAQSCSGDGDCNDSNICTDDTCVANNCLFTDNTAPCDDGLTCTINDTCGNGVCRGQDDCSPGEVCSPQAGSCISPSISFTKSTLDLAGASLINPTSLQFGPDGKLYVLQQNGVLRVFTVTQNGPNDYEVTANSTVSTVKNTDNHDDDGTLNTVEDKRLSTGMLVTGTAQDPVIYVASSDPRIGGGKDSVDKNVDSNSGIVHRLTPNGSGGYIRTDLVRGLPRSEENHTGNGMALSDDGSTLFLGYGGHTNMGAPSNNFVFLPEYALSAAILSIDLDAIGNSTYDIPTLDDEDRMNVCSAGATSATCDEDIDCDTSPGAGDGVCSNVDVNDPFGGNQGKNQAKLVPGGPVQVFAPGFRNPYDVLIMENGRMYSIDNGPNAGWGDVPVGEGPAGTCTNAPNEPGVTYDDGLHFVTGAGYYGGHPNPTRANPANTFNGSNPQSPVTSGNSIECDYQIPGQPENGSLHVFSHSTNGMDEYRASTFAGQLAGQILTASFNNVIYRIALNGAGDTATLVAPLFSNVGGTQQDPGSPLDVIAQDDGDIFPGSIWVADHGADEIYAFEPADVGNCTGAYDLQLDEDLDGYDNADELDNGSDPCSAADLPSDNDSDFISNLNDPDDDNDGWQDHIDPFAIDPMNGKARPIPFTYGWENGDPFVGGIESLGWTGLMVDSASAWDELYDSSGMTSGGAAGVMTVDEAAEGDALGATNTQRFAFQVGVDVPTSRTEPFTVHTRIVGPFLGITPQDFQSMGLFIGNGDQDNYFKVVTAADAGGGSVESVLEVGGSVTGGDFDAAPTFPGPDAVDLYLIVDPAANTAQAAYTTTSLATQSPLTPVGTPESIPASWLDDPDFGLSVGVISTSRGAAPTFPATWDFISVFDGSPGCTSNADCNDLNQCTADLCVNGTCQSFDQPDGTSCDDQTSCTILDICTTGVCAGVDSCPTGQVCNLSTDMCEASNADSDEDGLLDAVDPCPSEPRNSCFGPIAEDSLARELRVNCNVSSNACSGTKTDCQGDVWLADFGYNNAASATGCESCEIQNLAALFGCDDSAADGPTEDLFQCEHYDNPTGDPLSYTFDVPNGDYVVNLFFANTFSGTANEGDRLFNVDVEGVRALTDFDQVAAAGGATETAVVRSVLTTVGDGNGLTIEFGHVAGKDNPAIKAIEIFAETPASTTTTTTTTSSTTTTTMPECTGPGDCSDGNDCTQDVCNAGSCSNPPESAGAPCTDGNACTDDQCDGASACASVNNNDPCDDGLFCTTTDACAAGACTGSGDPCTGGDVCNESTDMCETPPCVDITAPSSMVCYENRVCTIPISLTGNGLEVSDAGTTIGSGLGFDCGPDCLEGAAATNGTCSLDTGTCALQVTDSEGFITPFADGELARVDIVCTELGTDQICLSGGFANDTFGAAQLTCTEGCVDFECGTCTSGDCNQAQGGGSAIDAGDPVCIVNCLVGSAPAGADCVCAADCNCVGGVEASDPVCAVLRLIGAFAPDSCQPGQITAASRIGAYAPDLRIKKADPKLLRDGRRSSVLISLKGTGADDVAGLRLALSTEGAIGKVRFVRRLKKAGWHLMQGRPGKGNVVVAVTPPIAGNGVPAIDEGKVLRVRLKGGTADVTISDVQFGSKRGLPITVAPVVKTP